MLDEMKRVPGMSITLYVVFTTVLLASAEIGKEEVDKVIEDEITQKLSQDLLQSIERKFQVDLERSVDSVLLKIKLLLQNGTSQIQDNLIELQHLLGTIKESNEKEVNACLLAKQNDTSALAEKALHQMVVCGYALIGHDPAQAVKNVMELKNMIKEGLKPMYGQEHEVYNLLKICGHDHDSLKKVIKCVISQSPLLKSAMMEITSKLIDGVVHLTKLMAHGAMHEACLIEVIKSVEDEAFDIIKEVRVCAHGNETYISDLNNYLKANNATVIEPKGEAAFKSGTDVSKMKELLRRMLSESHHSNLDDQFKQKFLKLQQDLSGIDTNALSNEILDN